MKKLVAILTLSLLCLFCAVGFTACGDKERNELSGTYRCQYVITVENGQETITEADGDIIIIINDDNSVRILAEDDGETYEVHAQLNKNGNKYYITASNGNVREVVFENDTLTIMSEMNENYSKRAVFKKINNSTDINDAGNATNDVIAGTYKIQYHVVNDNGEETVYNIGDIWNEFIMSENSLIIIITEDKNVKMIAVSSKDGYEINDGQFNNNDYITFDNDMVLEAVFKGNTLTLILDDGRGYVMSSVLRKTSNSTDINDLDIDFNDNGYIDENTFFTQNDYGTYEFIQIVVHRDDEEEIVINNGDTYNGMLVHELLLINSEGVFSLEYAETENGKIDNILFKRFFSFAEGRYNVQDDGEYDNEYFVPNGRYDIRDNMLVFGRGESGIGYLYYENGNLVCYFEISDEYRLFTYEKTDGDIFKEYDGEYYLNYYGTLYPLSEK